jgi:hypothetical protein
MLHPERKKTKKYAELVRLAAVRPGSSGIAPTFRPFVITSVGILGPNAVKVVDFLVSSFAKLAPARLDGLSKAYIIGNYRARLRAAIGCAAARGFENMLNRATAVAYGAR